MPYKVFLSHSTNDKKILIPLVKQLQKNDIQVFVSEYVCKPGIELKGKIFSSIDNSDCVVALLSNNSVISPWVNQEIGYAYKSHKIIVPIVEKGVDVKGILESKEYIPFECGNIISLGQAINSTVRYLRRLKVKKENQETIIAAVSLIVLGFCLYNKAK